MPGLRRLISCLRLGVLDPRWQILGVQPRILGLGFGALDPERLILDPGNPTPGLLRLMLDPERQPPAPENPVHEPKRRVPGQRMRKPSEMHLLLLLELGRL